MQIQAKNGLRDLVGIVEKELKIALEERKTLDLSMPTDFDTQITLYNSQGARAQAQYIEPKSLVCLNAAPLVLDNLKGEDNTKLQHLMNYFDIVRDVLGNQHEEAIFYTMAHPIKAIKDFEHAFASQKELQDYKELFSQRGTPYEEYKKFIRQNSKGAREAYNTVLPKIISTFKRANLSSLRHEIDHIDFFNTHLYEEFCSKNIEIPRLLKQLKSKHTPEIAKKYEQANKESLEITSIVIPLLESRAFFFNYIPLKQWDKTNFPETRKKVQGSFITSYVEGSLLENIIDKLVAIRWSKGEMDRETSNYLFYMVNKQRGSINSTRYVINPKEVNYDLANDILNQELPEWKHIITKNTKAAVHAISSAYEQDPSRFKKANTAKTFQEYVDICEN